MHYNIFARGALAQLGERQVRNLQARGSIPLCSTITGTGGNVTAAPFRLFYLFSSILMKHPFSYYILC